MLKLSAKLKNNQAYLMYWAIVCSLCVGVVACSDSALTRPEANDGGEASFFIRSKVVAATLSRAEVVITGSNMDEIRQDLTIDGDVITGNCTKHTHRGRTPFRPEWIRFLWQLSL